MAFREVKKYTLFNAVTPVAVTSSTDATPIVVTATSHGYAVGDIVQIFGHTTNIAANGIFQLTAVTTNTFTLGDRYSAANVAGSGSGAGSSGLVVKTPKIVLAKDFRYAVLTVITSGTATTTLKLAGSLGVSPDLVTTHNAGGSTPLFGGTVAKGNPYTFLDLVDLDSNAVIPGSTGIVVAGTDIAKTYEINVNGMEYMNLLPVTWTAGVINATLALFDNK